MISPATRHALEAIQDANSFDEARLLISLHDYDLERYQPQTCGVLQRKSIHKLLHMNGEGVYYSPDSTVIGLTAFIHWGEIRRTLRWLS